MDWLLRKMFSLLVREGSLKVTASSGATMTFGDGSGPPLAVRFTTARAERGLLLNPELKFGEAYMDGEFVVEQGSIGDVLALIGRQHFEGQVPRWMRPHRLLRFATRRIKQFNRRRASRRNVAHHYDLNGRLYDLFLDEDRQYSCAYFEYPGQSLEDAQLAKKRRLAAKLLVEPDHRVLDIGSGWGGLGLYLADVCGARVKGVTLSQEQLALSRERAAKNGLADRVRFELQDYRDIAERFDRIISVGMFEHVGVGYYDVFFRKSAELLDDDGVMMLHSIGREEPPSTTNPWIDKYIFPGGYIPSLSEVLPAVERAGLIVTDIEILRIHYAETLKAWRERFLARRNEAEKLFDARFVRMWEFYLAASEESFRANREPLMVFQIQMTKRNGVAPITRDYIADRERRLRALESEHGLGPQRRQPLKLAGE
ncbi:MAG: class I SAM-dependent methyltransferase [Rhizobiales bacterium]|nr:class I SAM-dependent methyltransferase [Hyphomicrobiales bacterium]